MGRGIGPGVPKRNMLRMRKKGMQRVDGAEVINARYACFALPRGLIPERTMRFAVTGCGIFFFFFISFRRGRGIPLCLMVTLVRCDGCHEPN
ncbi:hypothetical protein CGRA01v4_02902 [Colletotrichum graminicola]|nr:hypothetical protein CGRA01v4_02902 [Colletotrichum graminicola]